MVMPYPVFAGSSTLDIAAPVDLFAGSLDVTSNRALFGAGAIPQYTPIARNAAGALVIWAPAGTDGTEVIVGITAYAVPGGTTEAYYTGGDFNHLKINWPAGAPTTLQERQALFDRTTMAVSSIL